MLSFKIIPAVKTEYAFIINQLYVFIREDPCYIRFPIYNNNIDSIPTKDISEITKI